MLTQSLNIGSQVLLSNGTQARAVEYHRQRLPAQWGVKALQITIREERKAAGVERKAAGGDLLSHFGKVWKTSPLFFPTTLREHALRKWE